MHRVVGAKGKTGGFWKIVVLDIVLVNGVFLQTSLFHGSVIVLLLKRQNSPLTGGERVGHAQHRKFPQLDEQ